MLAADKPPLDEAALIHFGVKGMHWGERKEEASGGRKSGSKVGEKKPTQNAANPYALTDHDKAVLKAAGVKPSDSERMQEKYGSGSLSKTPPKPPGKLSDEQKDALKTLLVIGGVAAGAWFLYHRSGQAAQNEYFQRINPVERIGGPKRDFGMFRKEWDTYVKASSTREAGYTKEMVSRLSDESVDLKAGTIFKRISTERETEIRPGGFYASHREEDVNRYKAMLPIFWKLWGKPSSSGHIVNIRANADIKAPSPKKTYEMFRAMMNEKVTTQHLGVPRRLRDYYPGGSDIDEEAAARRAFPHFAGAWANENHPGTQHFFGKLKGEGYNAVVDMNDAGALSSKPMRLIDGTLFSIDSHERLSSEAIATAQEQIKAVVHAAMVMLGFRAMGGNEYLAHDGVKGMHWGVRKARDLIGFHGGSRQAPTAAQQHARRNMMVKAAIGVGVVAVGAILLKRGGFNMSSPASKKIMLGGAKASFKVLQKSGRLMATTSVKLGSTVGKTAVKGSAKVGVLAGKGAYKGAVAGSKAAGKAVAQNGSKFYEKGIKGTARATVKLGSHAMYKFTGRGTPIVNEVAKKSINLSPTDLLLNVRADRLGGRR